MYAKRSICIRIVVFVKTGVFEFVFFKTGVILYAKRSICIRIVVFFKTDVFEFVFFKTGVFCMRNGVSVFALSYFSRQVYSYLYLYSLYFQDRCIRTCIRCICKTGVFVLAM